MCTHTKQPLFFILPLFKVIAAPKDATIESVARTVGDLVQEGVALISLKA